MSVNSNAIAQSSPGAPRPLSNYRRFVFGGAGAIAPLIVLAISVEWSTVFVNLSLAVFFGYLVKSLLLFIVGGFVAYLQKAETDDFKCFVSGISAPALITTYAASTAHAGDIRLQNIIPTIQVAPVAGVFSETFVSQFNRGFSGKNPLTAIAIVGQSANLDEARLDAAGVELFVDCSIQGKLNTATSALPDESTLRAQGLSSETIVVYLNNSNTTGPFFVLMKLGPPDVAYNYLNIIRPGFKISSVVVINQAEASSMLAQTLRQSSVLPLSPTLASDLADQTRPDCAPRLNLR